MPNTLVALLRGITPQALFLRQHAPAAALSLQTWYAWRSASSAAGDPDPFTQQMQQKTEQELMELLEKSRAAMGSGEAQEEAPEDGEQVHSMTTQRLLAWLTCLVKAAKTSFFFCRKARRRLAKSEAQRGLSPHDSVRFCPRS
jgi:hypothetical protein